MCGYPDLCGPYRDFSLSDRLAVMYKGKFAGFFTDVENVTEDELGQHMLGIKHDDVLEGVLYE